MSRVFSKEKNLADMDKERKKPALDPAFSHLKRDQVQFLKELGHGMTAVSDNQRPPDLAPLPRPILLSGACPPGSCW
jgi:hypothetical protein